VAITHIDGGIGASVKGGELLWPRWIYESKREILSRNLQDFTQCVYAQKIMAELERLTGQELSFSSDFNHF